MINLIIGLAILWVLVCIYIEIRSHKAIPKSDTYTSTWTPHREKFKAISKRHEKELDGHMPNFDLTDHPSDE